MSPLKELFQEAYPDAPGGKDIPSVTVDSVECDSRQVRPGALFIAIRGQKEDGRRFIREAVDRGAVAVIIDQAVSRLPGIAYLEVADCRLAAAKLADAFYGHPSRGLTMVGITGTNGKTTSAYLLEHLLSKAGKTPGVLGTVSHRYAGHEIQAVETTPGPIPLQKILAQMRQAGCTHAAMEVSSHALHQHRVAGIGFSAALFTNLTQDHLDYHGTLEDYFHAKASLFTGLAVDAVAVLNGDDPRVRSLQERLSCRVLTFGTRQDAGLRVEAVAVFNDRTEFTLIHGGDRQRVRLPLVGQYNVYNALGVLGVMQGLGFSLTKSAADLTDFPGVPGRLESIREGQDFTVLVDFAHTPDGLENVLKALSEQKKGRLIVVFGCGGDRDKKKRPLMGRIAARFADRVVLTSDNPRSEDPRTIAEEVRAGFGADFKHYEVHLDRRKAIRRALMDARAGDIVLLAGKGHERTQIIGEQTLVFSDREEARRVLSGH